MNAYELADKIENGEENIERNTLATMLRQQADRIIKLGDDLFAERRECLKLEDRIAELEKNSDFWKSQYEQMCRDYQYYKELHDKELKRQADEEKASEERAKYGIY